MWGIVFVQDCLYVTVTVSWYTKFIVIHLLVPRDNLHCAQIENLFFDFKEYMFGGRDWEGGFFFLLAQQPPTGPGPPH